jgi:UDP-N-acetylmuramate--alanine ligase
MSILKNKKRVHFIGIGGIGMSGLARILFKSGYIVTGSDIKNTNLIRKLKSSKIKINIGHDAKYIKGKEIVIYSSSIPKDNPELAAAEKEGIPVLSRGQLLALLMNKKKGVAVTGTHGKTTTSALLSYVFLQAGLDPTFSIGAEVPSLKGNSYLGKGEYFIAEADESDGSFLHLKPLYSAITNIEEEHLDYYSSLDKIIEAYRKFAQGTKKEGCLFICGDDKNTEEITRGYKNELVTFGLKESCDVRASNIKSQGLSSKFDCFYKDKYLDTFSLNIPGLHNIINSLCVIAISLNLRIDKEIIKKSLSLYSGAERRFQIKGTVNDITVIEDYAHHPTEIKATLEAAGGLKHERIIVIFQPHRYSRTKHFKESFSTSLKKADYLILTDIYSASEEAIDGVTTKIIYDLIVQGGHSSVHLLSRDKIKDHILKIVRPKDLVLVLGAGDIEEVSDELVAEFKKHCPLK